MGTIVLSGPQNATLDGVVGDTDVWFGEDYEAWTELALADALGASAWLLGRVTYEFFSSRWRTRTGALAERLEELPKYVVSSTLTEPEWENTTVLELEQVAELKQRL